MRILLLTTLLANFAIAEFAGDIDGDGTATAIDLVRLSNHLNGSVPLSADRLRFADTDQNGLINDADRLALADVVIGHRELLPLGVIPTALAPAATNAPTVTITGHATPNSTVTVLGGLAPASTSTSANGTYSVEVTLRTNQPNRLYVSTPNGPPRTLRVIHDDIPPTIELAHPGALTVFPTVTALGRVSDDVVRVEVDDQEVPLVQGTFASHAVPVAIGNTIVPVVATDAAGNSTSLDHVVERITDDGALQILSEDPPTVKIPWPNKLVTFERTSGDGTVNGGAIHQVFSDAFGVATATFSPGTEAGRGNHRLVATSVDVPGTAVFHASADPGDAILLHVDSGDRQIAEVGAPAPLPLRVRASDGRYGIADVPVTFTAIHGNFAGARSITVLTDASGHAEASHSLADQPGNQLVEATFPGNQLPPVTFVNEAIARDQVATSLRGFVHDNTFTPLAFSTCNLRIGDHVQTTFANSEGAFLFDNLPAAGLATLSVSIIGHTTVSTNLVLTPNADNRLPDAIRLSRVVDQILFDNSADATLSIFDYGGFRVTLAAGSLQGDPRPISLDAVHADELPAPLPDGARPPLAWYLGPDDAVFDPPIAFEIPNASGLPPGSSVHVLGYNASIGEFLPMARATVSAQGDRIYSDPDSGITRGGFGAYCPPYPVHGAATTCTVDCGDPVELIGGSLDTLSQAFVGDELILDLQVPTDPGQEAVLICGGEEQPLPLAPQAVTSRIDIYRNGSFLQSVGDSFIPDQAGNYELELVAELRGPCPKTLRISRTVEVFDVCPVVTCITPATLTGTPTTERTATILALGDGGISLGFALRSPQTLEGGLVEYNCNGQTITRTHGSRPVSYTWQLLRRHDGASLANGTGTVASATIDSPGCYYAVFTANPGTCVSGGQTIFESAETSVIDAALSIDAPLVCVGDTLTGSLDLSAPPCDGSLELVVTGGAELTSSDDSSFSIQGTTPGVSTVELQIDGTTFASASFTVYELALPADFALCVGHEVVLPLSVQPPSVASEFANSALPLSIVGTAQFRSGISLSSDIEVTLGGLSQGGVIVRGLAAGECELVTPCGSTTFTVAQLALSGSDLCTGNSAEFALSMNADLPVTLRLRTDFGQGSAQFADSASDTLLLTGASSFNVDGLATSSDPENLVVEAFLADSADPCASFRFTVAEFAFAAGDLKLCVDAELPLAYSVSPAGFSGDVTLRTSDPATAVISGNAVRGIAGSNSLNDTQVILSLDGVDCASRTLTVIEVIAPEEVRLCLGQANTVTVTAKPADAACSVNLALNPGSVTFGDGSRAQTLDLASLDSSGLTFAASSPSSSRNDTRLTVTGPNGEVCGSIGVTVIEIGFSDPGAICIGIPGSVTVSAQPPLHDLNVNLTLAGAGLAAFASGSNSQTFSMAALDGQTLQILGLSASTSRNDMAITATTEVGACSSQDFTVVDISFDADDSPICVGGSRVVGLSASPADPNCTVTLALNDASRATFTGGVTSIQKSLGDLNDNGIVVHGIATSATAGDIELAIDVGSGSPCYHKSLSVIDIQFDAAPTFCSTQQIKLGVTALPNSGEISVPVGVSGDLSLVGSATRTLASLNAEGVEVSGTSGSVDLGCAMATPSILNLGFASDDLKVCLGGTLDLPISGASGDVSATLRLSDGTRAQFANGSTEITDTLANLASSVQVQGLATSATGGDIALSLEVNGVECASATLTVFDVSFTRETLDLCLDDTANVGVTAMPSINDCSVTITTTGTGAATIDGNASRTYTLAELNLLGVSLRGDAVGSRVLVIDAGAGCDSVHFTITDCAP